MDNKITRTTITLPEDLLYEVKKKSLTEKKPLKDIIAEGLRFYIVYANLGILEKEKKNAGLTTLFGSWGKGKKGLTFLRTLRYGKNNNKRDTYLSSLWKQSS